MAWLVTGGVVVTLGALIATAVFSPLLALEEIRVTGTSRLDASEVQDAVDSQLGTPLALVDFDQLTQDLSDFPLIRSYVTETIPPHTLVIHVSERQPVASVMAGDGYLLIDPAGVEIEQSETRPAGVPLLELEEDEVGGDVFAAAIEVLLALPAPLLAQVDRVAASTLDDVTLVFAGGGQRVVWGSAERSELKARVLERLMAAHGGGSAVEFDVTAPLSAVVRPL
ncbi:FtsQ-type POTRA domain-containing protein [Salinibacterium sp. SYSU T00001]|uniref:FtsQ-type POTRA domain-containing protein n=1 Tax=Homoserinimonas sedimenticola TaxID=2986805 RepID=UPI0022365B31|nr:FtsQ-type POTRA domain-containing protein [Salinibacterium sedimenticola]MCW4384281.1 FtsQ-type POTRA domain-containing protein [Salinibacterium sedimenticola]